MKDINNFKDIDKYLRRFKHTTTQPYNLKRMKDLMKFLGNPQNKIKIIHVAGTSGKTSTSYYIASLLKQAGYSSGLSISPHIDEINERLQINLTPLNETDYIKAFNEFIDLINTFDAWHVCWNCGTFTMMRLCLELQLHTPVLLFALPCNFYFF